MLRIAIPLPLAALLALAAGADELEAPPDWTGVAEVETVQVLTQNQDGSVRDTTVWLAVVDGEGYVRTGGSRWGENLQRDPELRLRIEDAEYALRAHFVENDELRDEVVQSFREKYGFGDALVGLFRGSRPKIMRLTAR